jgi:hypothetical protein
MLGESTGGLRTDYIHDAEGNVTATVDQSPTIQNSYTYKPFGAILVSSGAAPSPVFMWKGTQGVWTSSRSGISGFDRRYYDQATGTWTTALVNRSMGANTYGLQPMGSTSTCQPDVHLSLSLQNCEAECCGLFNGFCCYCFRYMFDIRVKTNGCKNCRLYQWVCEDMKCFMDDDRGWPYPWEQTGSGACSEKFCTATDQPQLCGTAFCRSQLTDSRSWVTTLICDGYCKTWTWGVYSSTEMCCSKPSCRTYGPSEYSSIWPCPPYDIRPFP